MTDAATQIRYRVEGMDCAGCAAKIDTAVRRLPGIEEVSVSATAGAMTVRHNGQSDLTANRTRRDRSGLWHYARRPASWFRVSR